MKAHKILYLIMAVVLILGTFSIASAGKPAPGAETVDNAGPASQSRPAPAGTPTWVRPETVLWDNGPLVTHVGGGFGGADASALQTALGMNTYGFGHQFSYGYRVADDFTITDAGGWQIDTVTFFAYQSYGNTTCSFINHVNFRIWDGVPGAGGSHVVFGDTTTNRLISATWSNIYRVLDTNLTNTDRPVCADTASAGVHLGPGTYWLDWQTGGTLSSGPWAPPVTILGQTTTGNGMQSLDNGVTFATVYDSGTSTPQDFPFIIESGAAGPTMHVHDITIFQSGTRLKAGVTIFDNTGAPVGAADVTVEVSGPIFPRFVTSTTNTNGQARFVGPARPGTWQLCVDDVVKSGFTYDPTQNVETCDTFTVP